jgi:hypothetical protein
MRETKLRIFAAVILLVVGISYAIVFGILLCNIYGCQ